MSNDPLKFNGTERTDRFLDNAKLNAVLSELSAILKPAQQNLPYENPKTPIGCIIGNPRSGTTILLQWLASLGTFSYPTNLLARFAYAPYIGALIQKMLFDSEYDYHGDFEDIQSGINFSSDLGKSKGALACNEFQHFFRNHMPNFDLEWLDGEALNRVDCSGIAKGLASIEAVLEKPFVTKANILQFNLDYFSERIPSLFWIHITREPIYVMQSILLAREHYYGNRGTWWSVKPGEYQLLKEMDIYHQIAGQVYYTEKAINTGLQNIPEPHRLRIDYESFCADPKAIYAAIRTKYSKLACTLPADCHAPSSFEAKSEIRLPAADLEGLQAAYHAFQNGVLDDH